MLGLGWASLDELQSELCFVLVDPSPLATMRIRLEQFIAAITRQPTGTVSWTGLDSQQPGVLCSLLNRLGLPELGQKTSRSTQLHSELLLD